MFKGAPVVGGISADFNLVERALVKSRAFLGIQFKGVKWLLECGNNSLFSLNVHPKHQLHRILPHLSKGYLGLHASYTTNNKRHKLTYSGAFYLKELLGSGYPEDFVKWDGEFEDGRTKVHAKYDSHQQLELSVTRELRKGLTIGTHLSLPIIKSIKGVIHNLKLADGIGEAVRGDFWQFTSPIGFSIDIKL